jgi:hypothetical protein
MLKNASHVGSSLAICALLLKRDMSDLLVAEQQFQKIFAEHRQCFTELVTDEKIEAIKINLDNFKHNAFAKAYQLIMLSLQELESDPLVWQGKLDSLIQSDSCYADLQKNLADYKALLESLNNADKDHDRIVLLQFVSDLIPYLILHLPMQNLRSNAPAIV